MLTAKPQGQTSRAQDFELLLAPEPQVVDAARSAEIAMGNPAHFCASGRGTIPVDAVPVEGDRPMLTAIASEDTAPTANGPAAKPGAAKKVVIVNGSPETLRLFEMVLDGGHYDVVFVESNEHAYSQIKHVRPNLVILCVCIDEMEGFQVLSMLKLDEATRGIPVLTYTTECEGQESDEENPEFSETDVFSKTAEMMN